MMTQLGQRSLLRRLAYPIIGAVTHPILTRWDPYSRLFLKSDSSFWVISWEMRELARICRRLGIHVPDSRLARFSERQCVFYGSHLSLLGHDWYEQSHRIGTAYFHGMPGTSVPEFDRSFHNLCKHHYDIHRVQVSHTEMQNLVLSSGIDPSKVFLIPIGVNTDFFSIQTPQSRYLARERLDIPQSTVVIGSFQKDGVGWGEGFESKLIKGPDIFLKVIERLKAQIPELFVLLSGPARGYVKSGLERLGTPYRHIFLKSYPKIAGLYNALDLYLVTSRQEGGPKAVLESMASGIPLVTTRVGQAMDLVKHGHNGWMVDVEDVEGLAYWAAYVIQHPATIVPTLVSARKTAESNSYASQQPLWQSLLTGFVAP